MPLIVVTSNQAGEGKTGVAAAIARHYAYLGRTVRLARVASDEGRPAADAAFFGSLDFAPGSANEPVPASALAVSGDDILVAEAGPEVAASIAGARLVAVSKGGAPVPVPAGATAVVLVRVPAGNVAQASAASGDTPLVVLAEDRTLAGFSVAEAKALLGAETLIAGDGSDTTCDHLVISPISSDAGQPHLRRFPAKAVVVRFDRTDQHLAALRGGPECLILTGGRRPSSNALDAAASKGIPVLLGDAGTAETVAALETLHEAPAFCGGRKLDRMCELLGHSGLFEALAL